MKHGANFHSYLSIATTEAFGADEMDFEVSCAVLAAEIQDNGSVLSRVYYLDSNATERFESGDMHVLESAPSVFRSAALRQLSWRFHDGATGTWKETLEQSHQPTIIELTVADGKDQDAVVTGIFLSSVPSR